MVVTENQEGIKAGEGKGWLHLSCTVPSYGWPVTPSAPGATRLWDGQLVLSPDNTVFYKNKQLACS